MAKYNCQIKFTTDYLQQRFTGEQESKPNDLLYQDEKGIYVPSHHIKAALINAGKFFEDENLINLIKRDLIISEPYIYIGKKKPDYYNKSYVMRENRETLIRPAFKAGLELKFNVMVIPNSKIDSLENIKGLLAYAGDIGVGAYHSQYGKFEVVKVQKVK